MVPESTTKWPKGGTVVSFRLLSAAGPYAVENLGIYKFALTSEEVATLSSF